MMLPMKNSTEHPVLTVSELNRFARGVLEMHVGRVAVTGEISNFSAPASGHWYFTLKDAEAQIRCAMFRNRNMLVRWKVANGKQVTITGNVSLYEGRGEFQLVADAMEESGLGSLQRRFEELKKKLQAEGLFESSRKKKLPAMPSHIGVVTSPTGAAIHDILRVLQKRMPQLAVTLIPCAVQGDKAVGEITQALKLAEAWNQHQQHRIDLLIVGRGGGSLEDLWAFNEEAVARAIFACPIPIISAVGHEIDTTIADFVADVRAPTPSAAAEMASPDQYALFQQLDAQEKQLQLRIHRTLASCQRELALLQKGLRHPAERLTQQSNRVAELRERLLTGMQRRLQFAEQKMQKQAAILHTVSPLATLQRGYAIVTSEANHVISNSRDTEHGATVTARLGQGRLTCTVTGTCEE